MPRILKFSLQFISRSLHVLLGTGGVCIYQPTCSHYSYDAIQHHGIFLGSIKSLFRILRCHPFAKGGWDPVTEIRNKRTEIRG